MGGEPSSNYRSGMRLAARGGPSSVGGLDRRSPGLPTASRWTDPGASAATEVRWRAPLPAPTTARNWLNVSRPVASSVRPCPSQLESPLW